MSCTWNEDMSIHGGKIRYSMWSAVLDSWLHCAVLWITKSISKCSIINIFLKCQERKICCVPTPYHVTLAVRFSFHVDCWKSCWQQKKNADFILGTTRTRENKNVCCLDSVWSFLLPSTISMCLIAKAIYLDDEDTQNPNSNLGTCFSGA